MRRIVLLSVHFTRNLAYYRAGLDHRAKIPRQGRDFWVTVNGNFLDECVLEFSKLFGITGSDRRGAHYWGNAVSDASRFEGLMFQEVDRKGFDEMFQVLRTYRNKFHAHLDEEREMNPPALSLAKQAVGFYHRYVVENEMQAGELGTLPENLDEYYDWCFNEAEKIYQG